MTERAWFGGEAETCLAGGLAWTHLRRRDKGVRGGVGVVPGGEVPVEGRDDGVLLSLLHVSPESTNSR